MWTDFGAVPGYSITGRNRFIVDIGRISVYTRAHKGFCDGTLARFCMKGVIILMNERREM